jgi:DNA-binding response OmpR family regulator
VGAVVWVVERDHWPRACLRAELLERGYDAVGFERVADALVALWQPGRPAPALVVIDLGAQTLDARTLAPFVARGCRLVAIAGAVERESEVARSPAWAAVLARPLRLGAIADLVQRLVR